MPADEKPDTSDVFVLIPDRFGVSVVAVGDLYSALIDDDTLSLEHAITNSAIDSVSTTLEHAVAKVKALNETGDADAYWSADDDG